VPAWAKHRVLHGGDLCQGRDGQPGASCIGANAITVTEVLAWVRATPQLVPAALRGDADAGGPVRHPLICLRGTFPGSIIHPWR